jgi:hypothetical protein
MCWSTYPHEWRDLWRSVSSRNSLVCHQIAGSGSNESRRQTLRDKPCKGTAKEPLSQSKGIKKLLMQMSKSDPSPEWPKHTLACCTHHNPKHEGIMCLTNMKRKKQHGTGVCTSMEVAIFFSLIFSYFCFLVPAFNPCQGRLPPQNKSN